MVVYSSGTGHGTETDPLILSDDEEMVDTVVPQIPEGHLTTEALMECDDYEADSEPETDDWMIDPSTEDEEEDEDDFWMLVEDIDGPELEPQLEEPQDDMLDDEIEDSGLLDDWMDDISSEDEVIWEMGTPIPMIESPAPEMIEDLGIEQIEEFVPIPWIHDGPQWQPPGWDQFEGNGFIGDDFDDDEAEEIDSDIDDLPDFLDIDGPSSDDGKE